MKRLLFVIEKKEAFDWVATENAFILRDTARIKMKELNAGRKRKYRIMPYDPSTRGNK